MITASTMTYMSVPLKAVNYVSGVVDFRTWLQQSPDQLTLDVWERSRCMFVCCTLRPSHLPAVAGAESVGFLSGPHYVSSASPVLGFDFDFVFAPRLSLADSR